MIIDEKRLKQLCDNCPNKALAHTTRCPFAHKYMCPEYSALKISSLLEYDDFAQLVPVDLLLKGLRAHGYTGELRKAITVTI